MKLPFLMAGAVLLLCPLAGTGDEGEKDPEKDPEKNPRSVAAAKRLHAARESGDLPEVGDPAPDFRLKLLEDSEPPPFVAPDAAGRIRLSDYRGRRPVVLIFGSYT